MAENCRSHRSGNEIGNVGTKMESVLFAMTYRSRCLWEQPSADVGVLVVSQRLSSRSRSRPARERVSEPTALTLSRALASIQPGMLAGDGQ